MKKEDFDEMKAFCNEKGFELLNVDHEDNEKFYVIAVKKDPWKGVEFARYKFPNHLQFAFFKVKEAKGEYLIQGNGGELFKGNCEPITESVYIEQLKKEAHERFGEIKEGDRFETTSGCEYEVKIYNEQPEFDYCKKYDQLFYRNVEIYEQGKWATKLPEKAKVKGIGRPVWNSNDSFGYNFSFNFKVENGGENIDVFKTQNFLADQLEKYLNKEVE